MVNEPHISPESLSGITSPTLVIAGTRDLVKRRHTELIASSIPNSQLCFVRGNSFRGKPPILRNSTKPSCVFSAERKVPGCMN